MDTALIPHRREYDAVAASAGTKGDKGDKGDPGTNGVNAKVVKAGEFGVSLLEMAKVIPFSGAMPTPYQLAINQNGLAGLVTATSRTTNSFTANMSVSISGTLAYIAVEQ